MKSILTNQVSFDSFEEKASVVAALSDALCGKLSDEENDPLWVAFRIVAETPIKVN